MKENTMIYSFLKYNPKLVWKYLQKDIEDIVDINRMERILDLK